MPEKQATLSMEMQLPNGTWRRVRLAVKLATATELLALELLAANPGLYAFQVVHKSGGRFKRGEMHTTLQRLERKQLISKLMPDDKPFVHPGKLRPTYTVTDLGLQMIQACKTAGAV